MMQTLKEIVSGDFEFKHIKDYYKEGIKDNDWIPQLGKEGGWIVISGDRAKRANKGGKLPELCKQHGITHVLLSSTLHQKKAHEKLAALALIWNEIAALHEVPLGTRFILRYKETKAKGGLRVVLERETPAPDTPDDEARDTV
jgi:hypothetical protein